MKSFFRSKKKKFIVSYEISSGAMRFSVKFWKTYLTIDTFRAESVVL